MVGSGTTGRAFISYSHQDNNYLRELRAHLGALDTSQAVDYWMDTRITPGSTWRQDINDALKVAKVAILLISPDFLASEFIQRYELPPLLEAAKAGETRLLGVIVKPCQFNMSAVAQYQSVNQPNQPLSDLSMNARGQVWQAVTQLANAALHAASAPPSGAFTRDRLQQALANRESDTILNLSGQTFSGLNLSGLGLRRCNLSRANLRRARLCDAVCGAGLFMIDWVGTTDLSYADLSYADLSGANLSHANLRGAILRGANLTDANLDGCDLRDANLYAANLTKAQLHGLEIKGASFEGVNAQGAGMTSFASNWKRANFAGADLQGCQLAGVSMTDANLREANLRVAKLKDGYLTGSDLQGAQLQGADLRSADLKNVNFTGADLTGARLTGAKYNRGTLWPEGFDALVSGAVQG